MKWRSVKPKPREFLWRTSVLGPFQPTPTASLPGRVAIGGRGLSPAEERPSLRPFACGRGRDMMFMSVTRVRHVVHTVFWSHAFDMRNKRIQIKHESNEVSLLEKTMNPAGGLEKPRPHWVSERETERERERQMERE